MFHLRFVNRRNVYDVRNFSICLWLTMMHKLQPSSLQSSGNGRQRACHNNDKLLLPDYVAHAAQIRKPQAASVDSISHRSGDAETEQQPSL